MKKGFFITLEGIEGSGKTTLAEYLRIKLEEQGFKVVLTHEPGGPPPSERIRNILLDRQLSISPWTELLLFMASRRENTEKIILPALKEGYIVISDRYMDSSLAYQGYGRGLPIEEIEKLNSIATCGIEPDITFLLDISIEESLRRMKKDDRIEKESYTFFKRVREGYLQIARRYAHRFVVLQSKDRKVMEVALKFIKERLL